MTGSRRFAVEYDPRAVKELKKLDKPIGRRITRAITQLADDLMVVTDVGAAHNAPRMDFRARRATCG